MKRLSQVLISFTVLVWLVPAAGHATVNVPWVLVGNAASESTAGMVALTTNSSNQAGAMWNPCAIDITQPFDLTWTVNFGTNQQPCGADGMAFVLQANGTTGIIGGPSGEHGYSNGNISNSLAVILDTFTNNGVYNDPPWNSLGIEIDGNDQDAGPSGCTYGGWTSNGTGVIAFSGPVCDRPPISATNAQVPNGSNYTFEAVWDPTALTMTVVTTTVGSAPSTQAIWTLPSNYLSTIFGSPTGNLVYYGFTASTGGSTNAEQAGLAAGTVNGVDVNTITCAPSPTPGSLAPPNTTPTYCGTQSPTFTPQGPTNTPTITFTPYPLGCGPPTIVGTPLLEEGNPSTSNSFAMTIPYEPNELLVVRVSNQNASPAISSMTYNGTALTQVMSNADQQGGEMETWILKAPSFGSSYNLNVDFASNPGESWDLAAMVYQGVNQASPIGTTQFTTNSGSPGSFSDSITTVGTNSLLEDFIAVGNGDTYSLSSGQTAIYQSNGQTYGSYYQIFGDYKTVLAPGAYSLTYSASYAQSYSSELIEIEGGAACASPTATWTNSRTSTATNSPTPSPTSSNTVTATTTNTVTMTDTQTPTNTVTNTVSSTQTNTATLVNTATVANSPTATSTNSLTATVTQTYTDTATQTFTPTFTDTLINTATVTNTLTNSPTVTWTATMTATYTDSATPLNTFTATSSNTPTHTNTQTPTNTVSSTPTNSFTPTHTPTVTATFTFSSTPTPLGNYMVKVNVYNSAGEVVKTIAIIQEQKPITSVSLPNDQITTLQGPGGTVSIYFNGALIGTWDGTNNAGSPVSNGNYLIEIDNVDPTGAVTTVSSQVIVNRSYSTVSVAIFNSAGELVKTLFQGTADSTSAEMTGVTLSTQLLRLGALALPGQPTQLQIEVATSGSGVTVSWNGMGESGQMVTPGLYEVEVHWTNGQGGVETIVQQVLVMPGTGSGTVVARPNELMTSKGITTTIFDGSSVPNAAAIQVKIYTIAGQEVTVLNSTGSPEVPWNAAGAASGIYIAVSTVMDNGGNTIHQQRSKVMVLR